MSALTKVFIVLLVVMSLLLSAGLIVFVNHQEPFKAENEGLQKDIAAAKQKMANSDAELAKVKARDQLIMNDKDQQILALRSDVQTLQGTISGQQTQLAEKDQNIATLTGTVNANAQALQVAQAQIAQGAKNYDALRAQDDKLRKDNVDLGLELDQSKNTVDVMTKRYHVANEQVVQLEQQLTQAQDVINKYNLSPAGANRQGAINNTPAVDINGYVQGTQVINDVKYATISLGSADQVARGMQFKVIDPTHNQFLGYVTIDTVEPHAATGHLSGPAVAQIRRGTEVRTHL